MDKIKKKYEKLRCKALTLLEKVVGDYCYTNNITYSVGMGVNWHVYVDETKVNDDCDLIADPEIHCYIVWTAGRKQQYVYDVTPDKEILDTIEEYEAMFGSLPLCDCDKGVWKGLK